MKEPLIQQCLFKVNAEQLVRIAREMKRSDNDWAHKLLYYIGVMRWKDREAILRDDMNIIEEEDGCFSLTDRRETRAIISRLAGRE